MIGGRHPKLTYSKLRIVDEWYRSGSVPMKTIAGRLGISANTLRDAALRRRAYKDCPRPC
jgi:hypothetical protein